MVACKNRTMKPTRRENLRSHKTVKRGEFPAISAAAGATLCLPGAFSMRLAKQ
jgi:hypothetical protein